MPKLKIIAVCEKVILDKQNVPSLIGIFQRMNIILPDAPLPENALAPTKWSIFTLWQHAPEEKNIEYTQLTEVFAPNGKKFAEAAVKFVVTDPNDFQAKNHIEIFGLPIFEEGVIQITVRLDSIPGSEGDYQLAIVHMPKEANVQTAPNTIQ